MPDQTTPDHAILTAGALTVALDAHSGLRIAHATAGVVVSDLRPHKGEATLVASGPARANVDRLTVPFGEITVAVERVVTGIRVSADAPVFFVGRVHMGPEPYLGRLADETLLDVFGLSAGPVEAGNAPTLFDRESDCALSLFGSPAARFVHPAGEGPDVYRVRSAAPSLSLRFVEGVLRGQGIDYYAPIDKTVFARAPTGWCTWYYYYQRDINEAEWVKNTEWLAEHLKPYGLEWVQLDDGWQWSKGSPESHGGRDWRGANRKFPSGMRFAAEVVKRHGLKPGIWLIPQKTDADDLYEAHPEYFLRFADGEPVRIRDWAPYGNAQYVLDPTCDAMMEAYYKPLWRTLADEWGFDYFKIDNQPEFSQWYADPKHLRADGTLTGAEVYRLTLAAIREVIGRDKYILGCYGIPLNGIGLMNGSRTGGDMGANWHGCQVMIDTLARWGFLNNTAWWCDPDTLCVREPLTLDEARLMTTLVSLSGQALMTSDKMYELPEERVELLRRACPTVDIRPMEFYPWRDRARPRFFDLKVERSFGRWDVLAVFNWHDGASRETVDLSSLGLPDTPFHVYDYWNRRYLGAFHGSFEIQVPRHACRLLALHEAQNVPQVLSTSRHITQGVVDLVDVRWDEASHTLHGTSELVGGDPYTITIHAPPAPLRYRAVDGRAESDGTRLEQRGRIVRLHLSVEESRPVRWSVTFKAEPAKETVEAPATPVPDASRRNPLRFSWDDTGADHYRVFRDGEPAGEAFEPSWEGPLLPPGTGVRYAVAAVGTDGRESAPSPALDWTAPLFVDPHALVGRAREAGADEGAIGPVGLWTVVEPEKPVTLTLTALRPDRYTLRIAVIAWQGMGRLSGEVNTAPVFLPVDTRGDGDPPVVRWVSLGEVPGGETTLRLTAEDGPVVVVHAERIPRTVVMDWLASRAYDNRDNLGFSRLDPPEQAEDPLALADADWRRVTADPAGTVDPKPLTEDPGWASVFLYTEVFAPEATQTEFITGAYDGLKVWLNGELVYAVNEHRGYAPELDAIPVRLRAGRNRLLLKVLRTVGSWHARLRVANPAGTLRVETPQVSP